MSYMRRFNQIVFLLISDSLSTLRHEGIEVWWKKSSQYLVRTIFKQTPDYSYRLFLKKSRLNEQELAALAIDWEKNSGHQSAHFLISLIMPVFKPKRKWLLEMVSSIQDQVYPHWELIIVDDGSHDNDVKILLKQFAKEDRRIRIIFSEQNQGISGASNIGLHAASGSYIGFVDQDDIVAPEALDHVARVIKRYPDVDIIYSDEDRITNNGIRFNPFFKPAYSPCFLLQNMYFCHLTIYSKNILDKIGDLRSDFDGSQDFDLALRASEKADKILHIPRILYHWRYHHDSFSMQVHTRQTALEAGKQATKAALLRRGIKATVKRQQVGYHIQRIVETQPMVSIIIPTKDKPDLLSQLLDSMNVYQTYPNHELIIVNNGSRNPETMVLLEQLKSERNNVRIIQAPGDFNFSRLINSGAAAAEGELLLLLNNGIEIIHDQWLEPMIAHALEPDVGAVGCLLLFPNKTIQHAGVAIGIRGNAEHCFRGFPSTPTSNKLHTYALFFDREVSAVTATCLLMKKSIYFEVGGLDDVSFKVAFNDVDLCLKLRKHNYRIIHTVTTRLIHHESLSKGNELYTQELYNLKKAWSTDSYADPYFNPNLSRGDYHMNLSDTPWRMPKNGDLPASEHYLGQS
ncbi:MAG: glycosyltransferase family 2 protein [Candidatus Latescibacterota bacterium]|nr:MAG: glycosyltransferase family 2 protein [Candidatus Latescibacterota bacterium]